MSNAKFRVALSGDFRKADGSPTFPDFDLGPLATHPNVEYAYVDCDGVIPGDRLGGYDALILLTHRFARQSVPADGRLAVVARFGVGYDSVDVQACTDNAIALAITPDGVRRPVAVAILTLMFALTGKLMTKDRLTRQGPEGFNKRAGHMGVGLVGRTLASVGVGNIGAEMFRLAKPLDMRFIAHDPYVKPQAAAELGLRMVDLETVFREGDVVTVNCPLAPETRALVNAERLALMKPTSFLINTARGPIVNQQALVRALEAGQIAGAGLDVLDPEPPPADDPILKLDNVIVAPHALAWTDQMFAGNGAADIRAVLDVMHGREPKGIVNRTVVEDAAWQSKLRFYREAFGA